MLLIQILFTNSLSSIFTKVGERISDLIGSTLVGLVGSGIYPSLNTSLISLIPSFVINSPTLSS